MDGMEHKKLALIHILQIFEKNKLLDAEKNR